MTYKTTIPNILTVIEPENRLPLIFDSPHSGAIYPPDFKYECDFGILEMTEDKYVDDLFEDAPQHGAALLNAHFPRSYIDVNRCASDIDPALLNEFPPASVSPSKRSQAGIGLIRRLIRPKIPVYSRFLTMDEIQARIKTYYTPYHDALRDLIMRSHATYGQVWHVNCHSMPPQNPLFPGNAFKSADIVLGDRDGTSCDLEFRDYVADFFKKAGYKVAINDPYKGVELVRRYADPAAGRHSLQLEICKSLYLEDDLKTKSKNYARLKDDLSAFCAHLADYVRSQLMPMAAD